jgi:hypothetical protein
MTHSHLASNFPARNMPHNRAAQAHLSFSARPLYLNEPMRTCILTQHTLFHTTSLHKQSLPALSGSITLHSFTMRTGLVFVGAVFGVLLTLFNPTSAAALTVARGPTSQAGTVVGVLSMLLGSSSALITTLDGYVLPWANETGKETDGCGWGGPNAHPDKHQSVSPMPYFSTACLQFNRNPNPPQFIKYYESICDCHFYTSVGLSPEGRHLANET